MQFLPILAIFCFSSHVLADGRLELTDALAFYAQQWEFQALAATTMVNTDPNHAKRHDGPETPNKILLTRRDNPIRYDVPLCNTTLFIRSGAHSLSQTAMTSAVAVTFGVSQKFIAQFADQGLPAGLDPLNVVPGGGSAAVGLTSQTDQKLTYGIIGAAMQGLFNSMISNGRFYEVSFEIWDGQWGHVGDGVLKGG
ncbi:MAG: hypothetical protein Q9191_006403 [Dirinaria sp. TL-2023a]